jgi:hypothetical protein
MELLVIPACVGLATTLASLQAKKFRYSSEARRPAFARNTPDEAPLKNVPPSATPPVPQSPPWEQPTCSCEERVAGAVAGAGGSGQTGRCIRCGSAVEEDVAFCDTCRARLPAS